MEAQTTENVNLQAQVGFDGYCKEGELLPVHVKVENTGADLNAEVQVSYKMGNGGKYLTSMNIDLPATSRKEFFLYAYFPGGFNQSWSVTLLANGQVLKKVSLAVSCLARENMFFGVLADNPSAFDSLNDVKPLMGYVRVAQLTVSDLPDRAQAWAALDALIVSNIDTGTLAPEQKQALKTWVSEGGRLLVTGGIHWQSTVAGLKDLLPVDLAATSRAASLSQLQSYIKDQVPLDSEVVLAKGKLRADAQVLVQQDGIPLLVQKQMGFGAVYFFAADPALQPLSNWEGMKDVYEHLLGSKNRVPAWISGSWYGYQANQAIATIPELGLPSIFYICGLLGIYILAIGPLNYFVLRRTRRRELAWVTIPALVVIFTCLAYGTGFSYRGTTPIFNRLAVAQAWDGMDQAQVRALVGIYSPLRTKYDLKASNGFVFQPFQDGDMALQVGKNWTTLQRDTSQIMPDVPLEIGAMKAMLAEGNLPALQFSHDLTFTLSKLNPVLSGKITNKSPYTLKDAILVTPGNWTRLGTLAPGATKSARVSLSPGPNGPVFYSLDSMSILGLNYTNIQTDEIAARRNAFLDTVRYSDYGMNQGNWGIYLMGWVDEVEIPVGLEGQNFKAIDTILYIDRLTPSVKAEQNEMRIPASLFVWESSTAYASPYYSTEIPAGGYVLRFQPAFPLSFGTVTTIDLSLVSSAAPQDLIVSAWDYENEDWVRISLTGSFTHIPEPARHVGPDGEIKIKIMSNRSDRIEITSSNISLVVQP